MGLFVSESWTGMPDWQPNWADVQFDHPAAAAITARNSAGTTIESTLNAEVAGLPATQEDWGGPAREEFNSGEQQIRTLRQQVRTLRQQVRDDLAQLARDIAPAAEAARAEQARRVADRQRWHQAAQAEQRHGEMAPG